MDRILVKLSCIHRNRTYRESPVVFVHGFPDSSHIFEKYYSTAERKEEWMRQRDIYTISFANRHNGVSPYLRVPNAAGTYYKIVSRNRAISEDEKLLEQVVNAPPTLYELISELTERHFGAALLEVINESPTGKVVIVAHDFGAAHTWKFLREYEDVANDCVEFLVSLSVGSSFRYDIWEHGIKAFIWAYDVILCLPYYFPGSKNLKRFILYLLETFAGYQSKSPPTEFDCWHYWNAPIKILKLPFMLLGFGSESEFIDFHFPVLFMRCSLDRIASTRKFEKEMKTRMDCKMVIANFPSKHFFPEHNADFVLDHIRSYHQLLKLLGHYSSRRTATQTFQT